ncbi:MAG TPA: 30S ribosomal protein S17 [Polyangia bacterium]|jgi:small subunit ribosomal protein S17
MAAERGSRRTMVGEVVSDKMDKTVVVQVARRVRHRMYHKFVTLRSRYKAHDERNECKVGDVVQIVESRPLSRDKRWRVQKRVSRPDLA